MPLPFSRVVVVYGEPIYCASGLRRQRSSRPRGARSKPACGTSRRWLITILLQLLQGTESTQLCMLCIPSSYSWVGLDCCRTFCGAACEAQRIIAISPSVLVTVLSLPPQCRLRSGCLWFHAASVGEVQGVRRLLPASMPACLSCLLCCLCLHRPANRSPSVSSLRQSVYVVLPLDLPWLMRRMMRCLRPRALIIQETELWPNLFRAAARQHIPVVLVNGRLSPRAFRRYQWIRPLMRRVLADVTLCLVQSEEGARRFQHLGHGRQASPGDGQHQY